MMHIDDYAVAPKTSRRTNPYFDSYSYQLQDHEQTSWQNQVVWWC